MKELVKFWKSSASGYVSRIFFRNSSTLQDRAFATIWLTSREKNQSDFRENFVTDVSLNKEAPFKLWSHSGRIRCGGGLCCCCMSFIPTTSRLAEQDRREVSLDAVILYSPASDLSALMIVSEYLSPSDDIVNLSLLADSSVPSLYLMHTTRYGCVFARLYFSATSLSENLTVTKNRLSRLHVFGQFTRKIT